jgi:sterol desaturase/sphingolipid hydroxylase (fatty acid hydroxylase superfamily)
MAKLYVSNKDESARIFKSDFLELFTHVHWSVPIILYLPVVVYSVYRAAVNPDLTTTAIVAMVVAGLTFWTLTEYLLHRFVFHYEPTSTWGKYLHFMMHGVHHDYPNDSKRLVMPPSVSIPLALLFYGLFTLILGPAYNLPFFGGFIMGYIFYDEIHYATHHAPMKFGLWQKMKHHHVLHHYHDPGRGYGVSSPLWDYVFGTMDPTEEKSAVEARQ